jgi:multiple sugar transport system ATP-binding protein
MVSNRRAVPLQLKNVSKFFGGNHVVKDLSLDVLPGEFVVLLGPSGCGKTTALRTIAGLEIADGGQVLLGDADITTALPKYRDIAMVFQSYALYPHKTVAENIAFPLKVRGIAASEQQGAVREAARQVHLEDLLDRYPRQLSGGQRQRVALARAIVRRPAVFLMDEPLSNLDAKLRGYMRAELKHMQHDLGVTTIYVTHDQVEAMTLAHRVAVMDGGVLQQIGTPREVYDRPANLFVAGFIGSPPMNFIRGEVGSEVFAAGAIRLKAPGAAAGKAVLGFRPEDAKVTEPGKGRLDGQVYASELMGDHVLATVTYEGQNFAVKMPKEFDAEIGSAVGIGFPLSKAFLFAESDGRRQDITLRDAD